MFKAINSAARNSASLDAALSYYARGFHPVPITRGAEVPKLKDWQLFRLTQANGVESFPEGCDIGLIMGYGHYCIELVDPCARTLAGQHLPKTGCMVGFHDQPPHLYFYRAADAHASKTMTVRIHGKTVTVLITHGRGSLVVIGRTSPDGKQLTTTRARIV